MDFSIRKWRLASLHAARPGRAEEGQAFGIKGAPRARKDQSSSICEICG
jgi:hypothetical protein